MANFLRSVFRAWLPPMLLGVLLACAGGSSGSPAVSGGGAVGGGPLGGPGNFANPIPVSDSGVAAPGVDVGEGQEIYYSLKMAPTELDAKGNPVKYKASGQLTDCYGSPYSKNLVGRYVRLAEPARRQFIDIPVLEENRFEAIWEVEPGSDPATQIPKVGSAVIVPIRFHGALATSPQACPMAAPGCLALDTQEDDPWFNLYYLNGPRNACTIIKINSPISNSYPNGIVPLDKVDVGTDYREQLKDSEKTEGYNANPLFQADPLAPAGNH